MPPVRPCPSTSVPPWGPPALALTPWRRGLPVTVPDPQLCPDLRPQGSGSVQGHVTSPPAGKEPDPCRGCTLSPPGLPAACPWEPPLQTPQGQSRVGEATSVVPRAGRSGRRTNPESWVLCVPQKRPHRERGPRAPNAPRRGHSRGGRGRDGCPEPLRRQEAQAQQAGYPLHTGPGGARPLGEPTGPRGVGTLRPVPGGCQGVGGGEALARPASDPDSGGPPGPLGGPELGPAAWSSSSHTQSKEWGVLPEVRTHDPLETRGAAACQAWGTERRAGTKVRGL